MSITSTSNPAFIEAEIYSQFLIENLHDGLLPGSLFRNVSDFGSGTTLNIPQVGEVSLQDVGENEELDAGPIDSSIVTLTITDFVGDRFYVTDKMREDGYIVEQLLQSRAMSATRAVQEHFETKMFEAVNAGQTASDPNTVNGQGHRKVATGTNKTVALDDIIDLALAFDKANAPAAGRILVVDPVVASSLDKQHVSSGFGVDRNPMFQALLEDGFAREHKFKMNLFGFDIWTSNRLPRVVSGTDVDGTTTLTAEGVANIAMCVAGDDVKPVMAAWRRMPKARTWREEKLDRDEFQTTARWGFGLQRPETAAVLVSDAAATE